MREKFEYDQTVELFSRWRTKIVLYNSDYLYDINKFSENLAKKVLNKLYSLDLVNMNDTSAANFPGIDLGDTKAGIAYQITSENNKTKILNSITTFVDMEMFNSFPNGIRFLLLDIDKPKIDKRTLKKKYKEYFEHKNIFTFLDLKNKLKTLYESNYELYLEAKKILEDELGDESETAKSLFFISSLDKYLFGIKKHDILEVAWDVSFISRNVELSQAKAFLENEQLFLPILGPGGVGKTRFAFEVCKLAENLLKTCQQNLEHTG